MKPTKTAKELASEILYLIPELKAKSVQEMEVELEHVKEGGSSDYWDWDMEMISIHQHDVASSRWGWRMFIPALNYFLFDYSRDYDLDVVLDENADMMEVGHIWDEIYSYASDVADALTELTGVEGKFAYYHLEGDGSFSLFYMHEKPEPTEV